jgi:hypothetical protein
MFHCQRNQSPNSVDAISPYNYHFKHTSSLRHKVVVFELIIVTKWCKEHLHSRVKKLAIIISIIFACSVVREVLYGNIHYSEGSVRHTGTNSAHFMHYYCFRTRLH